MANHIVRVEAQEYVCIRCSRRWDFNDEEPTVCMYKTKEQARVVRKVSLDETRGADEYNNGRYRSPHRFKNF